MNKRLAIAMSVVAAVSLLAMADADARRVGGGRSLGAQRAAPPAAAPSTTPGAAANPVMPRTAAPAAAAAAPAAAAKTGASRWLGPIAGIAAGLGLAALMSHMGLSEGFGSVLLVLLLVGGVVIVARMFFARKLAAATPASTMRTPFERSLPPTEPVFTAPPPAAAANVGQPAHWPADFDAQRFAQQSLTQFRDLQLAFDRGDRIALSAVMTPALYAEVTSQMTAGGLGGMHAGSVFETLAADVVDVNQEGNEYWVAVRFHGTVREDGSITPEPFDEQWNLVKPVDGSSGWLLAGIQQAVAAT